MKLAKWVIYLCLVAVSLFVLLRQAPAQEVSIAAVTHEAPTVPDHHIKSFILHAENAELKSNLATALQELTELKQYIATLKKVELTEAEFDLLCRVVAAEARGESFVGQQGVAQVIRDRLRNGNYGYSVSEVVYAPYQFAEPWQSDLEVYPTIATAVEQVFNGYDVFSGEVLHFFNPSTSNQGAVEIIRSGSMYFGMVGRHEFRGTE